MTSKQINCPELKGVLINGTNITQWGLVEYLEDVILPRALATADMCEMSIRVLTQLTGKRGQAQVGWRFIVSTADHQKLCELARGLVGQLPPVLSSPENMIAVATCNIAIYLAADVEDPKPAIEPV